MRKFIGCMTAFLFFVMLGAAWAITNLTYNPPYRAGAFSLQASRGTTVKYTFSADAAVSLATAVGGSVENGAGNSPVAVMISVEAYAVRVVFGGGTATQALGHNLAVGNMYRFTGADASTLSLANASVGENAVLQITMEY